MFCGDLNGKEIKKTNKQETYIYVSDLLCCTVETNNIVKKRLYSKIF